MAIVNRQSPQQRTPETAVATSRYAATLSDVREAASRIKPYAHRTPVMTSATLNRMAGRSLFFKCEMFQRVGAFKFRGACNAIMKLPQQIAEQGVVTHSSGNHAQAVALAAKLRGVAAHIVMPNNSSVVKVRAVEGYGATIYLCDPNTAAREGTAQQVAERTGATLIPPYNHADIIAGQATAALELLEAHPDLEVIVAPIGGGGLMSGTCIAAHGLKTTIRVLGAEPKGADDAARSLAAGKIIPQTNPQTIADGLLTSLGEMTWAIIRDHVARIITVSEDEIISATRLVWERMKIIIEPSSAVAVAAVLSDELKSNIGDAQRLGVILSGGNIDLDRLPWIAR
jgi:threonine dehydratase